MARRLLDPIHSEDLNWRKYYRQVQFLLLKPLISSIDDRVKKAGKDYQSIREAIRNIPQDPRMAGLVGAAAVRQYRYIKEEHTKKFERSMRKYFGVRYRVTEDREVQAAMRLFTDRNVSLIRTIDPRLHKKLAGEITTLIEGGQAFDQQALTKTLQSGYNSAGYNLKRIVRDQTNKGLADLNQLRQQQVGIEQYVWVTMGDEAVRSSHAALNGKTFDWISPPPQGHPGSEVLCRCVAQGILPEGSPRKFGRPGFR